MKKIVFPLSMFFLLIALSSFDKTNPVDPGKPIVNKFKDDYPFARNVNWGFEANAFVAKFENLSNKKYQLAYYSTDGAFIGQMWKVNLSEVPVLVRTNITGSNITAGIKNIYQFFSAEWEQKFFVTTVKNGKEIITEFNAKGESTTVRQRRLFTKAD